MKEWKRIKRLPMRAILCLGQVPGQPRLREDRLFLPVVIVIAVVLAVLVLILAALLAGISRETGQYRMVSFSNPEQMSATEWNVTVTGFVGPAELHGWRAILLENGTLVDELDLITDEPSTHLTFVDFAGHGELSAGDYFLVECDPSRSYELAMVWRDSGSLLGSEGWET